jgi:hypothetical protein
LDAVAAAAANSSSNGVGAFQTTQHSAACLLVFLPAAVGTDETARCVYLTFEQALERPKRRRRRCRLSTERVKKKQFGFIPSTGC